MDNQKAEDKAAVWFAVKPYHVNDVPYDKLVEMLILIDAIPALTEWVILNEYGFREAWNNCPASDWLYYLLNEFASVIGLAKDSEFLMLLARLKRRSVNEYKRAEPLMMSGNFVNAQIEYLQAARETIRQILVFNKSPFPPAGTPIVKE